MTRYLRWTVPILWLGLLPLNTAFAQQAEQSEEQSSVEDEEAQAEKHFSEGRKLYAAGQYKQAIEALLKAYTLRPAPPILLNIARTYEKLGDKTNALKFYKEFLLKARNVDPNRSQVEAVVKQLEKEVGGKTGAVTSAEGTETPTAAVTEDGSASRPSSKQQLIHTPVDSVKVRQPITLVAELPPGVSAERVVAYFRKGGEVSFKELLMQPQGDAYIVQIPARYVTSTSLQYYLEALHGSGRGVAVAQAGTKVTPHIIVIEGGIPIGVQPAKVEFHSPYRTWAWASSGVTLVSVTLAIVGMAIAKDRSNAVEDAYHHACSTAACQQGTANPTVTFNEQAQTWESDGKSFATMGYVFLGVGIAAAGTSAYLWWKDRTWIKEKRRAMEAHFLGAPWVADGGIGFTGRLKF